jgi:signal transduction histidine kinase
LRNPLGAISNSLYVMRQAAAEKGGLGRAVERAERSIGRCNKIINNLLDYTVSRTHRPRRIAVDPWLEAIVAEQAIPDWVEIERRFDAPGGTISAEGERLGRAVANLIENAVQAVEAAADGEPRRITIATRLDDDVEIAVTDTGPGIAPDVLPQIFEPLFSTRSFGAGLGLAIVSQIVAQHGGTVGAESVVGRGTTVRLRFPRVTKTTIAA